MTIAMNRRTLYLLVVLVLGLTYFIYAFMTTAEFRVEPLSILSPGNFTNVSSLPLENDLNQNEVITATVTVGLNSSKITPSSSSISQVVKEVKKEVGKSQVVKQPSVIQHIPPKVENTTMDAIVQGIKTKSLFDAGFIIPNVELCPDFGTGLQVLIVVTSAPKHEAARMSIRQTWGHFRQRKDVSIGFIVGRTSVEDQTAIQKEAEVYSDIIQTNCVDSYNNLTLKTISVLEWVDSYCPKVKFLLKTDDDMFINVPKVLTFLGKHVKDKRKIYGRLAKKWKPIRNKASKYYVSPQQYKHPIFPDFLTGPAYVMTGDIVHDLFETALEKTYLKLEDVYTTGIVAQECKVQRIHINEFFNRRVTLNACNVQKGISIHMVKTHEQYDLWKKLLDGRSKC